MRDLHLLAGRFAVSDSLGKAQYAGAQLAKWAEAIAAALFGVPVPPGTSGDWLCLFKVVRRELSGAMGIYI